ncbi:MAG: TonB-dependent receptor protein [Chthoniobacteraceae bacterium]|nr:TonB-dependent receptor protein [Chthoniobacteraceae bacterium]
MTRHLIAAFTLATTSSAQTDTLTTLPTVDVTAAGEDQSLTVPSLEEARAELNTQPGGTAIIDAEQYKRGRVTTLKDALDFAPGVFVQPRFGAEESRISIRGSGIQRTFHGRGLKLLQDGVPLNLADGSFDFQAIEPLTTRYIEVYRGANALEFGATTLGGAINFVSLTGREASLLDARFEYGSFETFRAQLSSGAVLGPFDYYVSLSHFSTDGFREHSQQNNQRLFANFGYRITPELETRFFITYTQTDSELPGELTKEQLEDDPRQASRVPQFLRGVQPVARFDYITSNWKRDFELLRIANRTTWQSGEHRFSSGLFWTHKNLDHPILFVIDQLSNDFGIDLRYDNSADLFGHRNRLTLGFAPTHGIVEDNRFENLFGNRGNRIGDQHQTSTNLDFYLQEHFYLVPSVALVAGGQISYAKRKSNDDFAGIDGVDNSDSQDYWGYSPKLGLLWEMTPDAQAFLNVSRSFEPPSFGELANAGNNGTGLVHLTEQTATTAEIGTRGRYGRFAWDLAYYHAWIDDELLESQIQPGLTQTTNAGRTIHQGIEAALDADLFTDLFTRGDRETIAAAAGDGKKSVLPTAREQKKDRLLLRQVYLWNDFHFNGDAEFGDNQLPGIPEHYYRAELLYEHPCGFYAGPNVEWVPSKYNVDSARTEFADPYALLGFKIGYRSERGFSVFFEAKNLTDKTYASTTSVVGTFNGQALFFPGDGRGFYGGLEWKW